MICKKIKSLSIYKIIALGLVILSFALYAILPFNLCLPFSNGVKVGITTAMMVISEIVFWIGGMMLGKEIVMKVRKKISLKKLIQYIKK